jgi:type IX secretion system PorP/SprF family membrane protein
MFITEIMIKRALLTAAALVVFISVKAQQDAMFTHYSFNTLAINPAYAGSRDALTVTSLYRNQWTGFKGAPVTQTLTMHTPFMNDKIGAGLSIVNDRIGPVNTTSVYADYAYKIKITKTARLSMGLKGGLNVMQSRLASLRLDQQDDAAFANNRESKLLPNFGFGLYYYTTRWYAGVSTPKMLENNFQTNTVNGGTGFGSEERHYYFIAGTVIDIAKDVRFKPTTFVKVTNAAPIEADLTMLFIFYDKLEFGPMFRTGDAVGALFGINLTDQWRFGYSYDWSFTNRTFRYNGGSHELMLRYDFIYRDKAKILSPRFF